MGKPDGFIAWRRADEPKHEVRDRLRNFRELYLPLAPEHAQQQAGRCMDCGVPFCHQGCPLGNLIPDFNDAVHRGAWREAYAVLASTNNFPEWTGRLCPAPCEAACVLSIEPRGRDGAPTGPSQAVTIELVEKAIVERAFAEGWIVPRPPAHRSGRRIAVVGSGPAGLAAAAQLNQAGHEVTVFDRADRAGGLLRYGIPDFKLDKAILDRRLAVLEAEGVRFALGVDVGRAPRWDALQKGHDAVVVAIGAQRPRRLELDGIELDGVVQAMPYLEAQNRATAAGKSSAISVAGQRVVILGGGDTGSDCLGTALRQGAREVTQVELLPQPPGARASGNPWPQWPLVFRTSSSQHEGGARLFGRRTVGVEAEAGRLSALRWVDIERRGDALVDVPGTERRHPVDRLILALGFLGPETDAMAAQLGLELDRSGRPRLDERGRTSAPGVYCAGDAARGASLIVWAISDGREVARHVDAELSGKSALPTRGPDAAFGGR